MRWIILIGAIGTALLAPVTAIGQAPSAADAIQARQRQFREIGTGFKAINDELKKDAPGKFLMGSSARQIAGNLRQVGKLFPTGSGPSSGVKTKALPVIWAKQADFAKFNGAAIAEADKLALVLKGSDIAAMRAQAKVLGKTCQSCHQQFRAED